MYKIVPFSDQLDLTEFYQTAKDRGFKNNQDRHSLVGTLESEKQSRVWILYCNNRAVGSVAAHSFDSVMGPNSYRIAARTCVFTDMLEGSYASRLRNIDVITKHQNPTSQFLIPTCMQWVPASAKMYITSNDSEVGTQRKVHRIFFPALEKLGQVRKVGEGDYRGLKQTVWEIYRDKYLEALDQYPRWPLSYDVI
jgi:hypothetical protein